VSGLHPELELSRGLVEVLNLYLLRIEIPVQRRKAGEDMVEVIGSAAIIYIIAAFVLYENFVDKVLRAYYGNIDCNIFRAGRWKLNG
jgi:hypothetical protein